MEEKKVIDFTTHNIDIKYAARAIKIEGEEYFEIEIGSGIYNKLRFHFKTYKSDEEEAMGYSHTITVVPNKLGTNVERYTTICNLVIEDFINTVINELKKL